MNNLYNEQKNVSMRKLSMDEMAMIEGGINGWSCAGSVLNLVTATAGLFALNVMSGGLLTALTVSSFITAPTLFGLSCFYWE